MSAPPPALIAFAAFAAEGYIPAGESPLLRQLDQIQPFGNTAMLSSMALCLSRIMKVNSVLSQIGMTRAFNFVHIVITDGVDNKSTATIEEVAAMFMVIGRTIPVELCKTFIIGIDLDEDPKCRQQLELLHQIGGENCEKYDIGSVQIEQIFDRIKLSLGVQRQVNMAVVGGPRGAGLVVQQTARPVVAVSRNDFAVLFNLDISGSMAGQRWARVKKSVRSFMSGMLTSDLVSCVCFNDQVMTIDRAVEVSIANQKAEAAKRQKPAPVVAQSTYRPPPPQRPSPPQRSSPPQRPPPKKSCCSLF